MQQQLMMMNMMNSYGGSNYYNPKGNMFIRRAKGGDKNKNKRHNQGPRTNHVGGSTT